MAPPEEAPPPAPEEAAPTPAEAEVPEWLRELEPSEEEVVAHKTEEAPSVPPFPTETEIAEVPEWLAELETEQTPPSPPAVPVFEGMPFPPPPEPGIEETEELARAEIPAWLEAMRPRAETAETAFKDEPAETEGLLEGLSGVLPPASTFEVPTTREGALPSETSEASLSRAQLLQSLLAQPAGPPVAKVHRRDVSLSERVQRWLVAAVLLVAVGAMLVAPYLPQLTIPPLTQPANPSGTEGRIDLQRLIAANDAIQAIDAQDTVLVAFEYGPAEADELDLVAKPMLQHLFDQEAIVSAVSTRPEGMAVAARLLDEIISSTDRYTETQYLLQEYRSGNRTGVAQVLAETDPPPRLVLVLTGQPGPLRWWVEQIYALGEMRPPIVTGVSAALEPAVGPYLDVNAGQLEGAVIGLSGAAAYETHRGSPGQATQRLNALAAGHAVIVALMIIGAMIHVPGGFLRRKK